MSAVFTPINLADEPDFNIGNLDVSPSACRITHGAEEMRIEAQTMTVLVALARANGATLSRNALTDSCWKGRIVSDDAIARSIAKVRAVVRNIEPPPFKLETVPRVGYRLLVEKGVSITLAPDPLVTDASIALAADPPADVSKPILPQRRVHPHFLALLAALLVGLALPLVWIGLSREAGANPGVRDGAVSDLPIASEVAEALVLLDQERVRSYLERGWGANWTLDSEGNAAIHTLFMACERNPSHNRGMVAVIAQMLVRAGADLTAKNKWDDTPLDIASSTRYCGPHHPVVDYLKSMSAPKT